MDADVALLEFSDVPFVIERPAEPSALADAAMALLSKAGLRMEFGQALNIHRQHDKLVMENLPPKFSYLSRQSGGISGDAEPMTILVGPARAAGEVKSPMPAISMAHQTWTMASYALKGTNKATAMSFATLMTFRAGGSTELHNYCATREEAWEWGGSGRGSASEIIRKIEGLRSKIDNQGGIEKYKVLAVADMAEGLAIKLSVKAPEHVRSLEWIKLATAKMKIAADRNGIDYGDWSKSNSWSREIARHASMQGDLPLKPLSASFVPDSDGLQSYLINASLQGDIIARSGLSSGSNELHFDDMSSQPQLGSPSPSYAAIKPDQPRFEIKLFKEHVLGPSFLPQDTFKSISIKTAQWIHEDLLKVVIRAKEVSKTDFELVPGTGGVRNEAVQAKLKKAGKSQAKIGRHTIGHAVDLVPLDGKRQPDFGNASGFEDIRAAMLTAAEELNVPIQWGGNWRMVDKPHFELDRKIYPAVGEDADANDVVAAFR